MSIPSAIIPPPPPPSSPTHTHTHTNTPSLSGVTSRGFEFWAAVTPEKNFYSMSCKHTMLMLRLFAHSWETLRVFHNYRLVRNDLGSHNRPLYICICSTDFIAFIYQNRGKKQTNKQRKHNMQMAAIFLTWIGDNNRVSTKNGGKSVPLGR